MNRVRHYYHIRGNEIGCKENNENKRDQEGNYHGKDRFNGTDLLEFANSQNAQNKRPECKDKTDKGYPSEKKAGVFPKIIALKVCINPMRPPKRYTHRCNHAARISVKKKPPASAIKKIMTGTEIPAVIPAKNGVLSFQAKAIIADRTALNRRSAVKYVNTTPGSSARD
jgi:hypothetical protein